MASDYQVVPTTYACRCLNIRITTTVSSSERPNYPFDSNYSPVFVDDDGIQVNHPQATVRLMSKPEPLSGTSKHSRFTALTCLFCALPVYRVHHVISLDVEGNTTTFLPSEEWVEKDTLKSGTGWIDIHKDCLTRDDVAEALSASTYVSLFAMTLPGALSFPPSPESNDETNSSLQDGNGTNPTYLPGMRPVFLPPPFTPSNKVFIHLADVANKQSESLRSEAEERIRDFIMAEAAGILEKEKIIKGQVLCFWKEFKHHLGELQLDISRKKARSPTRLGDHADINGVVTAHGTVSSVVSTFTPTPLSSSVRHAMSPSQPRVSVLSASLATSAFYYPHETRGRSSEIEPTSPESDDDQTPDFRSISSTLVQSTASHAASHAEEANILQFRRTVNDDINTHASYRYFVNLEEDMGHFKRAKEAESNREKDADIDQYERIVPPVVDTHTTQASEGPSEAKGSPNETSPPRGRDKGKRKVTFSVEPAVLAIEKDEKAPDGPVVPDQEAIFRLDVMASAGDAEVLVDDSQNTLPLLEQPPPRPVTIKRRSLNAGSEAFHSLRPASLPAPSHVRPIRSPPGVDSSHRMLASVTKAPSPTNGLPKVTRHASPLSETERQFVAAGSPSRRGTSSDDWNLKSLQEDAEEIVEEDGEDQPDQSTPVAFQGRSLATDKMEVLDLDNLDNDPHMVGSLPMKIKRFEPSKPLSLASYVGQDAHSEIAEPIAPSTVNGKKPSSSSIRKAVYLEKDRARAIDPGPLDAVVEDEEVDDDEDDDLTDSQDEGEKARVQASRILQARSELPEEGMWRSLA